MRQNIYMANLEQRKHVRYSSTAKARIMGINKIEILVKDLSITGGCLKCHKKTEIRTGARYSVEIIPEKTAGIGKFDLAVDFKWVHDMGNSIEFGFFILESPKGKLFQRYVDYLSWLSGTRNDSAL